MANVMLALWPWMHVVVGAVMVIAAAIGLLGPAKTTKVWAMVARVCYVLIILSGVVMILIGNAWHSNPWLFVLKILAALALIGMLEMGFAKKLRGEFSLRLLWAPLVLAVVVFAIGFVLTGGTVRL